MFFITNSEKRMVFGWSPKCGCTHVKSIVYFLNTGKVVANNTIHDLVPHRAPPQELAGYEVLLFIRNPYQRLVSGFLNKYGPVGELRHLWDERIPLTFSNFVDQLIKENYDNIEYYHFCNQTEQEFNDEVKDHNELKIYDIADIDYAHIERAFGEEIPKELMEFKGEHAKTQEKAITYKVYDLVREEYDKYTPLYECFYDVDLKAKVYNFYKNDFDFFESNGVIYDV